MIRLQSSFRIHNRNDQTASPDEMRLDYQSLIILSPLSFSAFPFLGSLLFVAEYFFISVRYQSLLTLLELMWQKWGEIVRYHMNNLK